MNVFDLAERLAKAIKMENCSLCFFLNVNLHCLYRADLFYFKH